MPTNINRVIVCEELNHVWEKSQLSEVIRLWNEGYTIHQIAKYFRCKRDEVVIALLEKLDERGKADMLGTRWGVETQRKNLAVCID